MLVFLAIFSKYLWFQTKWFTRLLEFIKLDKQNPFIEIYNFFLTIYQNYTLALTLHIWVVITSTSAQRHLIRSHRLHHATPDDGQSTCPKRLVI